MERKEELQKIFVTEAKKYGEARISGNSTQMNKQSEIISNIKAEFLALGKDEINVLKEFLNDKDEFVRLHIALSLLKTETNKAIEVLNNLTKVRGPVAVEARIILSEWKKGKL